MAVEPTQPAKWSWLRIGVVAASVSGLAFWCGAVAHWWQIPDSHRDGLEVLGPVLATAMLFILVLPAHRHRQPGAVVPVELGTIATVGRAAAPSPPSNR